MKSKISIIYICVVANAFLKLMCGKYLLVLLQYFELTRSGRGKPSSSTSSRTDTQGAHNPLMAKKPRKQQVPVEKTFEPWPPITNGLATIVHFVTAQAGGWRAGDRTWERMRHSEEIFLTRSEIHLMRGSNTRPRGATRETQPSVLRTFHVFWINVNHLFVYI
jgi:hypothetical protein